MSIRKFKVSFSVTAEIELDTSVFDAVDDEWRRVLYPLMDDEDIVEHVSYLLLKDYRLSHMDGWADQPDENAELISDEWEFDNMEEIL